MRVIALLSGCRHCVILRGVLLSVDEVFGLLSDLNEVKRGVGVAVFVKAILGLDAQFEIGAISSIILLFYLG